MKDPVDPRSTWRKRARAVLKREGFPYFCGATRDHDISEWGCGRSPSYDDAPGGTYPGMGELQANHKNKILSDIDPANLEWLCASCHKEKDSLTEKGVSYKGDEWGYSLGGAGTDTIVIVEDDDIE
jgi:hypothetical protein